MEKNLYSVVGRFLIIFIHCAWYEVMECSITGGNMTMFIS